MLDKLKNQVCRAIGPSIAASLEPLAHRPNAFPLSLFYIHYFDECSSELVKPVPLPLPHFRASSTCYSIRLHDFSYTIPWCYEHALVNSFFPHTAEL